ncbi:GntR family transcriptional regulator, partial [Bacillus sp. JJ1503]
ERKMKVIEEQLMAAIQNSKEIGVELAELKELLTMLYKEEV